MDVSKVDKRFQSVFYDQRFRSIKQKHRKVKIDQRFASMFTDDKFKLQYHVDKRGKPVKQSSSENLRKYYRISNKTKQKLKLERKKERKRLKDLLETKEGSDVKLEESKIVEGSRDVDDGDSESDLSLDEDSSSEEELEIDLARGEGNVASSSDDEEEEEEDEDVEMLPTDEQFNWDQLDNDAETSEEVTRRLALCNMDWEKIRADDIMVLMNGFKPTGGSVRKVTIFPSDFGAKRMAEESKLGPKELLDEQFDGNDEDLEKIQNERLRAHQINRLKYYFAVIECDTKETAEAIYEECDGVEYESSSSKLDLRFIPDDMEFTEHPARDSSEYVPDRDQYKPSNFVTTALNQQKVRLTWDETDHKRLKVMTQKYSEEELANMDMQDFLASSSDEEEDEKEDEVADEENDKKTTTPKIGISSKTTDQDQIARYRSMLLGEMDEQEKNDEDDDVDMEITWEPTLDDFDKEDDIVSDGGVNEEEEVEEEEELEEEESKPDEEKSKPASNPKKKKKRKKQQNEDEDVNPKKRAELEMLMMDAEDAKLKHFDIHEIMDEEKMSKKKRKQGKVQSGDDFALNMDDSRFSAVFTSPEFALDPNNPAFRKTKAMKGLLDERQHRLHYSKEDEAEAPTDDVPPVEEKPINNNLNVNKLIESIKAKTKKQFSKKSKKLRPTGN